jgi:hypothetical protein
MRCLVFYANGRQLCSLDMTDQNRAAMHALFCMTQFGTDRHGGEHWALHAMWNRRERTPLLRDFAATYGEPARRDLLRAFDRRTPAKTTTRKP